MTTDLPLLVFVILLGLGMGGLYFGSLWWTVHRLPRRRHRLRWFFANWGLRVLACLGGVAWIVQQTTDFGQQGLLLTLYLVGFWVVRTIWLIILQVESPGDRPRSSLQEHL